MRKFLERRVADTDLETFSELRFQLERWNDRNKVGIAATLAEAIERTLNLPRTGSNRGKRVRHRLVCVVVGVDPDVIAGNSFYHLTDDLFNFVRQRSAIRIAQDNPPRAFFVSGLGAGQRVFRIGLVTIKEMFAVEENLPALCFRSTDTVTD